MKSIDLRALRVMGPGNFSLGRLRREVDVMLGLRHPNIVELYGAYGDTDSVRLVMELVDGEELFDAILSRGHFDEGEAKPIFGSLCAAVAYMHARGVIHRDLKPENVLVTPRKDVKLVDFGLSKLVASGRGGSAARTMVGTPSYLAPEIEDIRLNRRHAPAVVVVDDDLIEDDVSMASSRSYSGGELRDRDRRSTLVTSSRPKMMSEEDTSSSANQLSYDAKVDAWSMGVTLYVMLIARFPVYRRDDAGHIAGVELPPEAKQRLSPQAQSLIVRLLDADPRTRCSVAEALKDPWLETTVASFCSSPQRGFLAATNYDTTPSAAVQQPPPSKPGPPSNGTTTEASTKDDDRDVIPVAGYATAHAALVAAASLRLPDEMRRAGLVYHERALASRNLASKLRSTADLVLETLDDLAFAIDAKQAEAARDILRSVRRWTSELTAECTTAKQQNLESMRNLADFAESIAGGKSDVPRLEGSTRPSTPMVNFGGTDDDERSDVPTGLEPIDDALSTSTVAPPLPPTTTTTEDRRQKSVAESLELASDDDVLELLLPVTADDLTQPHTAPSTIVAASEAPYSIEPVIKCLGELHVIFSRMELFWSKVEVSLDTVLRRSEALETLLKFSETPKLKARFDKRLDQFRQFWQTLATWNLEIVGLGPKTGGLASAAPPRQRPQPMARG